MRIVDTRETDQRTAEFPLCRCWGLDPVCCDSKIPVGVAGLPRVARQADPALDSPTLQCKM